MKIKQLKVFEFTLELNKVSSAVNKAVYSKSSTNINDAKKLVLAFYDLPIREELLDKLNSINPSSGGNSGGGGGGGGGGGSSSPSKSTSPVQLLFRRKIRMKLKRQKTSWTHIFFVLKI